MSRRRWLILVMIMLTLAEMAACGLLVRVTDTPVASLQQH